MNRDDQLGLPIDAGPVNQSPPPACAALPQLGLTVDHRRLFRALEDGWLRP